MVIPKISQDTLADMVGATRARVGFFMNKFRKPGFIDYNRELQLHHFFPLSNFDQTAAGLLAIMAVREEVWR
jgi:hypothetical protein